MNIEPYLVENDVVLHFGETIIVEQPNLEPWASDDVDLIIITVICNFLKNVVLI